MRCAPLPEFLRKGAHPVGLAPERLTQLEEQIVRVRMAIDNPGVAVGQVVVRNPGRNLASSRVRSAST